MPGKRNPGQANALSSDFLKLGDENTFGNAISMMLGFSSAIGIWPVSSVNRGTGALNDISPGDLHLSFGGNVTYTMYDNYVPIIELDGTGDYFFRADESKLRVTGIETHNNADIKGMSILMWVKPLATGLASLMSKRGTVTNFAFDLQRKADTTALFDVSDTGTAMVGVTGSAIPADVWSFVGARFTPGTELMVRVNDSAAINTSSIPASIFAGTADFAIGGRAGALNLFAGRMGLIGLYAAALPDRLFDTFYYRTKKMMGKLD